MKLKLYHTRNSNNTIGKVLEDEQVFDIDFKDTADVIKPVIRLYHVGKLIYNYAYIPDFDKYYFINNIDIYPNYIHKIKLETDVLETYKDDILESEGIISRSTYSDDYYDGGDYRSEERMEHVLYKSDKSAEFESNTILVTIGG